jgi:hypothetical protein
MREKYKIVASRRLCCSDCENHLTVEACQAIADEELAEQKAKYVAKLEAASKFHAKPIVELSDIEVGALLYYGGKLDRCGLVRAAIAAHIAKQSAPRKIKARWYIDAVGVGQLATENSLQENQRLDLGNHWRGDIFELPIP